MATEWGCFNFFAIVCFFISCFIQKIEQSPNLFLNFGQDKEYFRKNFLFWRCLFDFFDKSENFAIMNEVTRGRAVW